MNHSERRGLWVAIGVFFVWGLTPLWWHALHAVPSLQIVLHRIVWSAVLVGVYLTRRDGRGWLRAALSQPSASWMLALSGILIGLNWGLYIWAVNAGKVVEASLGYYINPLFNVLLGVVLLRERLRPAGWVSVAFASIGVAWMTVRFDQVPWVALALAGSFSMYGLIRKLVTVEPTPGLGVEGAYLLLPATVVLASLELQGNGGFLQPISSDGYGVLLSTLLIASGPLTVVPLVGFSYAVRRVPLSVMGLLQYIAPTLQFLLGVLAFHEHFGRDRAIGFACIWIALAILATDGAVRARVCTRIRSSRPVLVADRAEGHAEHPHAATAAARRVT